MSSASWSASSGPDVFGAQDAGPGGQGVVGEVNVDLGLARTHPSAGTVGTIGAVGAGWGGVGGVGVVLDLGQAGVQGALGGGVQGFAVVGVEV